MKKVLSLLVCAVMLCMSLGQITISAANITLDEIQKGTVIAFDSVNGDFNTTEYYVKILENGEEVIYQLSSIVYLNDVRCDAEQVTEVLEGDITFVLKSGKIKYINPTMPEGLFEKVEIEACYKVGDVLYANVSFENIVDEFKLIMVTYSEDVLCAVKTFDISYLDSYYELEMDSNGGDIVKLFFWEDILGLIPICEKEVSYIPTEYGYLISVNETNGGYEFEIFTANGDLKTFECANEIGIDEEVFDKSDSSIKDRLEFSAESANKNYEDELNNEYHQPIMYKTNEQGEIAHIDTVACSVNPKISKLVKNEDGESYYVPYGYKEYKAGKYSLYDFKVNSKTKIIFVPDDRSDMDEYIAYENYSDAFINARNYHVEAYGLSATRVASLVLIYKENDNLIYTYKSPKMIVESVISDDNESYVRGYTPGTYTLDTVKINTEKVDSIEEVNCGDIIRYLVNNYGEMSGYQVWYDADNALQKKSCDNLEEAIENRILELITSKDEPVSNYPNATFRLQYGTVWDIEFHEKGDMMWITPSIAADGFEMVTNGDGVVGWEIKKDVKVYEFDGESVEKEADLTTIEPGETEVIAYSAGGGLIAVYIIRN